MVSIFLAIILGVHFSDEDDIAGLPVGPPPILKREYSSGNIYNLNYSISSKMEDHSLRVNYSAFCGIFKTDKYETEFIASIQKRSEEVFKK